MFLVTLIYLVFQKLTKPNSILILYKKQERKLKKPCSFLMILLATPLLKHTTFAHTNLHLR